LTSPSDSFVARCDSSRGNGTLFWPFLCDVDKFFFSRGGHISTGLEEAVYPSRAAADGVRNSGTNQWNSLNDDAVVALPHIRPIRRSCIEKCGMGIVVSHPSVLSMEKSRNGAIEILSVVNNSRKKHLHW